jgi:hypothetical protein
MYRLLYKIKNAPRNIKRGVRSLIHWLPVIWESNWWDYEYLLDLMEHQLKLMSSDENKSYTVGWDDHKKEMRESLRLLDAFKNASCFEEENELFDEFISSLKIMRGWWD